MVEVKLSVMVQRGKIGPQVKVKIGSEEENDFLFNLYFSVLFLVILT